MGLFSFLSPESIEKASKAAAEKGKKIGDVKIVTPKDILVNSLRASSGHSLERERKFNIFYQVIGFQGCREGVGCSTIVANTALALAHLGLTVAVLDTSFLSPSQENLLRTDRENDPKRYVDWYELATSKKGAVSISTYNRNIGVLAFYNRGIVELLSGTDDEALVTLAIKQLRKRYDIILVDICGEQSNVVAGAIHNCQKIIQVWTDSAHSLRDVDMFVRNNVTMSCPLDKMRYVITSMTVDDINTDWDVLLKKYNFKHLSHVGISKDIARVNVIGKPLFNFASGSPDIQEFNDCLGDIVAHLLNVGEERKATGTITTEQITKGEVEGTVTKKLRDRQRSLNSVIQKPETIEDLSFDSPVVGEGTFKSSALSEDSGTSQEGSPEESSSSPKEQEGYPSEVEISEKPSRKKSKRGVN